MQAKAIHYAAKCAPRKVRRLRPLVVGKSVMQALAALAVERRCGSVATIKLIKSAMAQLPSGLAGKAIVAGMTVNEGPKRTMFMPRAQGRATPIVKRTSHISVELKLGE